MNEFNFQEINFELELSSYLLHDLNVLGFFIDKLIFIDHSYNIFIMFNKYNLYNNNTLEEKHRKL